MRAPAPASIALRTQAVQAAHAWVRSAIEAGAGARIGSGHGPLNHGFAPLALRRLPAA